MSLKFNKTIDWLTVTFRQREFPETVLPLIDLFEIGDRTQGGNHYDTAYKLACGGTYAYSKEKRQGIMIMLPGQALGTLRQAGWSDAMTVNWAMGAHNVTRIDYAIDVFGGTAKEHSPHDAYNAGVAGNIKTKMRLDRSYTDHSQKMPGDSYYWGSPKSDARVVCYNKGVQMRFFKYAWTRVEMRLKGEYAKGLVSDMNDYGVISAGDAKLKAIWDADIEWFEEALSHDEVLLTQVHHKPGNFAGWLEKSVKPAMLKNMDKETDAIRVFHQWLTREIEDKLNRNLEDLTGGL